MKYTDEVFKPMVYPGYDVSAYRVSNYGRVKKLSKSGMHKAGYHLVKIRNDNEGYCIANICGKDLRLNRILGFTFLPNDDPENKTVVDHINGDKLNNYCGDEEHNFTNGNLRWLTPGENTRAAIYEQGLHKKAENCSIIGIEVATMKAKIFRTQSEMARYLDTDARNVNRVITNWEAGRVKGWRAIKINSFDDTRYSVETEENGIKTGSSDINGNWVEINKDGYHITIVDESRNVKSQEELKIAALNLMEGFKNGCSSK